MTGREIMKIKSTLLCLLPLFLSFTFMDVSRAGNSTITISGNVRDNACTVSIGSQNFTVDLMNNATKQFYKVGAVSPNVPFSIVFDKCGSNATAVKLGFTGVADGINPTLLMINGVGGAADGVGVQLLDQNNKAMAINPAESDISWIYITGGQSNVLHYYARLMATKSPVTAGTVNATANFILEFL